MVLQLIIRLILLILILGLASAFLYYVLPIFIKSYEKLTLKIVNKMIDYKFFQKKLFIYIIYFLNIVLLLTFIIILTLLLYFESPLYLMIMIVYPLIFIFTGTLLSQLKSKYKIQVKVKLPRFLKENYFINRISFFFDNTLLHLGIYFSIIYVCLAALLTVDINELPYYIHFIYFIMLPIAFVLFINTGNKNKNEMNFRRIIIYLLLFYMILTSSYHELLDLANEKEFDPLVNYLSYITLAVFTGLDNLVQAINHDYKNYKNESK